MINNTATEFESEVRLHELAGVKWKKMGERKQKKNPWSDKFLTDPETKKLLKILHRQEKLKTIKNLSIILVGIGLLSAAVLMM